MSEKRRILLVDGNNLLFQMFFGIPARITDANGIGIWGVLGFVGALLKIFRYTKPTHVAVLFDGEHENKNFSIVYVRLYLDFALTKTQTPCVRLRPLNRLLFSTYCRGLRRKLEFSDWRCSNSRA